MCAVAGRQFSPSFLLVLPSINAAGFRSIAEGINIGGDLLRGDTCGKMRQSVGTLHTCSFADSIYAALCFSSRKKFVISSCSSRSGEVERCVLERLSAASSRPQTVLGSRSKNVCVSSASNPIEQKRAAAMDENELVAPARTRGITSKPCFLMPLRRRTAAEKIGLNGSGSPTQFTPSRVNVRTTACVCDHVATPATSQPSARPPSLVILDFVMSTAGTHLVRRSN